MNKLRSSEPKDVLSLTATQLMAHHRFIAVVATTSAGQVAFKTQTWQGPGFSEGRGVTSLLLLSDGPVACWCHGHGREASAASSLRSMLGSVYHLAGSASLVCALDISITSGAEKRAFSA